LKLPRQLTAWLEGVAGSGRSKTWDQPVSCHFSIGHHNRRNIEICILLQFPNRKFGAFPELIQDKAPFIKGVTAHNCNIMHI
jgi:hypothetical protein